MPQVYKKVGHKQINGKRRVLYSKGGADEYVKTKGRMMNVERYEKKVLKKLVGKKTHFGGIGIWDEFKLKKGEKYFIPDDYYEIPTFHIKEEDLKADIVPLYVHKHALGFYNIYYSDKEKNYIIDKNKKPAVAEFQIIDDKTLKNQVSGDTFTIEPYQPYQPPTTTVIPTNKRKNESDTSNRSVKPYRSVKSYLTDR